MSTNIRRRGHLRPLLVDLAPEDELAVRLDRTPADLAAALDELDAAINETSKLHKLFISQAVRYGQYARTAEGDDNRRYHLANAISSIARAQDRRRA